MSFGLTILSLTYIIFIIVPGVIFKKFFYQNNPQKAPGVGNFADRIITSIFFGVLFQALTVLLFTIGLNQVYEYEFKDYYNRILNIHKDLVADSLPIISFKQISFLFIELILSLIIASICGFIGFNLIRKFKLDVLTPVLKFDSEWKYLFRDDKRVFDDESASNYRTFDSAQVDLLVKDSTGDSYLYSGVLFNYKTNKDGSLENISLLETKRYKKTKANNDTVIKDIPGHIVIVPYSNILNMNITYMYRNKESNNRFIDSVLVVFFITSLFPIIILPWFATALWYHKIFSIIILFYSWANLVGLLSPFLGQKKERLKFHQYLFMFLSLIVSLFSALYIININLITIILEMIKK
ncbi:hypothetical protein CHU00_17610 [Sphingobacterium cellulitidis]|uniref:hypothetical protein n=1 Tax=Sphingobacterium cellulitidis TaxID=1768011 RepID=UPI000B93F3AE|nr:hypothetical protein [Sphingobacterium cellulitidis]OYD44326.1 hypothetical protein CHU00_17610 [Sphingobacterium cellulitidis]